MFEEAARVRLRFPSERGLLSVEDVYQLPIVANGVLDKIYISLMEKQGLKGISIVRQEVDRDLELQIRIIEHIVATKIEETAERRKDVNKREKKEKIMEILQKKQDGAMEDLSEKVLKKMLKDL